MKPDDVIQLFEKTGALLTGHFVYASGRHGSKFLQASRVLQYPDYVESLCRAMADSVRDQDIQLVVGPATGGIILSYETARHVGCRGVFTEKEADGSMALKRGFRLDAGTRVLIVEDIITTGGSVKKTMTHLQERGAEVIAVAALIDRSGGTAEFDVPFHPLAEITLETYLPDQVPADLSAIPIQEPDDLVV